MKYLLLPFFLFFTLTLCAQENSDSTKSSGYLPLIHLSKEEIHRLPVMTFAELINQAFAFVSGNPFQEDDYTYEIDGYLTIHPNSINIGQIESITFYPGSTKNTRSSLTRNGTFVITTTKPKEENSMAISTRSGIEFGNDHYPINASATSPPYTIEHDPSFFTLSEVVYGTQLKKFSLNSSFSYARRGDPSTSGIRPGDSLYMDHINKRYRFSNFLGYRFNEKIALDGGIFFTLQDNDSYYRQAVSYSPPYFVNQSIDATRANYYGATLGLQTLIFKKISNEFRAEGNQLRTKGVGAGENITGSIYRSSISAFNSKDKFYVLSNNAKTTYQLTQNLRLEPSLLLRYRFNDHNVFSIVHIKDQNNFPVQSSESMVTIHSKGFSISPEVGLSYKNLLRMYAGASWDNYWVSVRQSDPKFEFYPVVGFRFDAASLLNPGIVSSIYMSSDYGMHIINLEKLNYSFDATIFTTSTYYPVFYAVFDQPNTTATRWISSIGANLWENCLGIKATYLQENREALFSVPVPGSFNQYIYEPIQRKGWSVEVMADVIRNQAFNWKIRGNIFGEELTTKNQINIPPAQPIRENYFFNTDKNQLKSSVSTTLEAGHFFLQGSAWLLFNEVSAIHSNGGYDYSDDHCVNFVIVGYKKEFKGKDVKNLEISLQTRNLVLPESSENAFYRYKYVGVGAKVIL